MQKQKKQEKQPIKQKNKPDSQKKRLQQKKRNITRNEQHPIHIVHTPQI